MWIIFAVFRYAKINVFFKISAVFLIFAVYVFFADAFVSVSGINGELGFTYDDKSYNNIVSFVFAVIGLVSALGGIILRYKRRKFFG